MKQDFYRQLIILIIIPFTGLVSFAQDLTGIWKGYFISDRGEYYKLEFQIDQKGSNTVTGVSYSYLDVRFYGKATMTGYFSKSSTTFKIREIKTVEVKSTLGGATCIMNYNFQYSKSGKEEFLEGNYLGKYEPPYQLNPPGKWGDCGGGKVYLRRVKTTDFYMEPFLRNKVKNVPVIDNQPPVKKTEPVKTNPPPEKKLIKENKEPEKKTIPEIKPIPEKEKEIIDPEKKIIPEIKTQPPPVTPDVLTKRTNELVRVLTVSDPEVTVRLYDNGEIDDDTISVYLDKKLVLASKRLTAAPLIIKFRIDEDNSDHEMVMVAENLGRIPPNTSLMIVESGEKRYEVRITSTEQKNAVVRFKYQKPK